MSMNMSNMVLLAMKQTAKGTPAAPTPALNAILCRGLTPQLIKGKFVERNLIKGSKGNQGALFTSEHREFDFEVELAGSGAAGTAPKFGVLLKGCDMSETITAATSVVYQPHGTLGDYLTLFAYMDGVLFKMSDAKSAEARKADARTSDRYIEAVTEEAKAAGAYEMMRALREAAAAKIEAWRTESSNYRAMKI